LDVHRAEFASVEHCNDSSVVSRVGFIVDDIADDMAAMVRTRASIIWVVTTEEARAERYIAAAAKADTASPMTASSTPALGWQD
jgi:hypothetical protein